MFTSLSYNELASAAISQDRLMKAVGEADEKKMKRMMPGSSPVVVLAVHLSSTAWCISHLGVSYSDLNSSIIGAITCNSNSGNSSSNNGNNSSSSSTVLLLHRHSRMRSGRHSNFPLATSHASTMGRWDTLLVNAASPNKATHHDLWHPW
jgi:hypothetical protein